MAVPSRGAGTPKQTLYGPRSTSQFDRRMSQTRKYTVSFGASFGVASRIRTDGLLDHNQAL